MWGKHLILNVKNCHPKTIRTHLTIYGFSQMLVKAIDMKAYGEPLIRHFGEGNKAGYTLVQLIETSNITAHFVEETNDAYIDVFSCKEFDPAIVEKVIRDHFIPESIDSTLLVRQVLR